MRRLSISLLLVVVLTVVGAGWAIDRLFVMLDPTSSDTLDVQREWMAALADQLDQSPNPQADLALWNRYQSAELQLLARAEFPVPQELEAALETPEGLVLESPRSLGLYYSMPRTGLILSRQLSAEPARRTRIRLALTILFYSAIATLILVWLYPLIRRLQTLARASRRFGEGRLQERIATQARSPLHDIETEFNRMASRIEELIGDNRLLTSAVSHDLRTPLARLRFGVDALAESASSAVQADYLTRLECDVTAMEHLVDVLLNYARLEQQLSDLPLHSIDLPELVMDVVAAGTDTDQQRVSLDMPGKPAPVLGQERYLIMLVNNVLQNALRHGRNQVHISVESDAGRVWLHVEDDGGGIAAEERENVLKPFVRGTASAVLHSPATPLAKPSAGYGMGLAIVARIAQWHRASLQISQSEQLGGARISVAFLPASKAQR